LSRGRLSELGLFYCALAWGATFFLVKDAIAGVHPVTMVAYRFLLAALILLPWVWKRKGKAKLLKHGLVLSLLLAVLYISQTVGLSVTAASNSGFITGLFIVFVPFFMFLFFGKPPTRGQWVSVALALVGLWLVTGGPTGFNRGDALTLLSAVTYAGHLLATDRYVKAEADTLVLAFHQFWMTGLLSLALVLLSGVPLAIETRRSVGIILFLTIFPTVTAFYVQMVAQKYTAPIKVSLIFLFEPVFGALFAWTMGGERFAAIRALGGGLIVLAMATGELSKISLKKGKRQEVLPV